MDITISNQNLTATINPLGAELTSLKSASGTEYIWEGDAKYWGKHSPVLFPVVGTLKNNSYLYNGDTYALTRHGFARDKMFSVINHTESSVSFSLFANDDTKRLYPFEFELTLIYTIEGNALRIDYNVKNKSENEMPFSLGAHPAFALPGSFSNYSLLFEKDEPLVCSLLNEEGLISAKTMPLPKEGNNLPLAYSLFENDALIFKNLESKKVTIQKSGTDIIEVSFSDFPHLGIWTKEDAPFICIEPWQGYSDSPNATGTITQKEGIKILNGGDSYTAGFTIKALNN